MEVKLIRQKSYTDRSLVRPESLIHHPLELMDLFIAPNIGLNLCVTYDSQKPQSHAGRYVVQGPTKRLAVLHKILGISGSTEIEGVISPMAAVTLPPAVKVDAGIPLRATHFAFVYPLALLRGILDQLPVTLFTEPWIFGLILGSFAYFDENADNDSALLAVNALTIVPSPAVLHLVGPYQPTQRTDLALTKLHRLNCVTANGLLAAGFRKFAWSANIRTARHTFAPRRAPSLLVQWHTGPHPSAIP